MSWATALSWVVGVAPRSSDFNQYLRDNFTFLYGTLTAAPFKCAVQRQGGDATNWQTAGTNNYAPTDAFVQCGVASLNLSTSVTNATATVTLPTALTGSGSAVALVTANDVGISEGIGVFGIISGSTALILQAGTAGSPPSVPLTLTINWIVVGR